MTRPAPWPGPSAWSAAEAERLRRLDVPADHGGLPLGGQRPAQQSSAIRWVSTGLSVAGFVTACGVIGLGDVFRPRGRLPRGDGDGERYRDPGPDHLRVFGEPRGPGSWGWPSRGHHVCLDDLVVGGRGRAP